MPKLGVTWKGKDYWIYGSGKTGIMIPTGAEHQRSKRRYIKYVKDKYNINL